MHVIAVLMFLALQGVASAHPGDVDACGGHRTTAWVEYGASADGKPIVPSEPGEYHFHFFPGDVEELQTQLLAQRPADHFVIRGQRYAVLEYTRQQEAILWCVGREGHVGIIRVRVP